MMPLWQMPMAQLRKSLELSSKRFLPERPEEIAKAKKQIAELGYRLIRHFNSQNANTISAYPCPLKFN
jgi:hypothetical protein